MVANQMLIGKLVGRAYPMGYHIRDISAGQPAEFYVNMSHHFITITNKAWRKPWIDAAYFERWPEGYFLIEPTKQIWLEEPFQFNCVCCNNAFLIPLTNVLLTTEYFKPVAQPRPEVCGFNPFVGLCHREYGDRSVLFALTSQVLSSTKSMPLASDLPYSC